VSFIGDSFTAGHGITNVDDRFVNRLRQITQGSIDVHALAEVGRDTGAEIKLIRDLRREGYQFDIVVLVYCLNDISDIVPGQHDLTERAAAPAAKPSFLVEHSYLINTYYYRIKARFDPRASRYYDFVRAAYAGPVWEQQKKRLRELSQLCESTGAQLAVVIFPFMHSLGANYDFRQVHETIGQYWQGVGVPCLDLLPVFEPHADEPLMVSAYDAHPNERAHELAAQAIFDWLLKNLP
jgi:hypothetical protein